MCSPAYESDHEAHGPASEGPKEELPATKGSTRLSWHEKRIFRPHGERVKRLNAKKARLLSKAPAFWDMGFEELAPPVRSCASSYEGCQ